MADDLFRLADKFRASLEADDRQVASRVLGHYGRAWKRIQDDLIALNAQIMEAKLRGEEVGPSWWYRQERYRRIRATVEAEIAKVADKAAMDTYSMHAQAIEAAKANAHALVQAAPGMETLDVAWQTNMKNAEQLMGNSSAGTPLKELFNDLPGHAGAVVENALVQGMIAGAPPDRLIREVRNALAGNMARAQTIARTEIHRAYRETTRRTYEANADVVKGWIWNAGLGTRTCAACYAMHGSKHPNNERLDGHPNCRCSMVPYTGTFEVDTGPELFERLSTPEKYAVLGPRKLALYEKGELKLEDLVGRRDDGRWGSMRFERSLRDVTTNGKGMAKYRLGEGIPDENPYPFDPKALRVDPTEGALGGAHSKTVYRDPDGDLWLFKPQEEFLAELDVATSRLQKLAGFEAPDTYVITMDGRVGSIQRMFGTKATRRQKFNGAFDPTKLDAEDVADLQRHSVFDWLISNHDGHSEQFIRLAGQKRMIAVDKGQAYKFFGKDKYSYKYNPNGAYIGDTVYNQLHRTYAQGGAVELGLVHQKSGAALKQWILELQNIPDETMRALLRPYAEKARAAGRLGSWSVEDFLDAAVHRKNRLYKDVENYHVRIRDERVKALGLGRKPKGAVTGGLAGARRFRSNAEGEAWGRQHFSTTGLDRQELDALHYYTGSSYADLNRALRRGETGLRGTNGLVDRGLQSLMKRHHVPEDVVVTRGVDADTFGGSYSNVKPPTPGSEWHDKGYMSTSVSPKPAFGSKPIILHIRVPKGQRGFYASLHSSQGSGEYELLLDKGVRYRILKVEKIGYQWHVEAEIIP